jgi:4-amino-4-deoxy-L-arabinose transferase-like glycosyltransferase
MPDFPALLRRGIRLPPSGWILAAILALYVLAGLFGRDPWKGEDAIHIGTAWSMLHHGDFLSPDLAGRVFHKPPLYYWTSALTGTLFGWLLPLHEALRLASAVWITLALVSIYYAGRELFGQENAAASPLLLAGTAGLLLHAHDAQPMLIAVAAYAGATGALAAIERRPLLAGGFYGLALAASLLGTGIAPTLPLIAVAPVAWLLNENRRKALSALAVGFAVFVVLSLPWPALMLALEPARFHGWLATELAPLKTPFQIGSLGRFSGILLGFAFPALPLAAWTIWSRRRELVQAHLLLPLSLALVTLLVLAWAFRPREIPALLMLPSIALLATPGALNLRRGATNAFDWFAVSVHSFFMLAVWVGWSAMVFGWPTKLAERVVVVRPGFVGHFDLVALVIGLAATAWWLWLVLTAPRSPYRSLTHWTLGFTILWLMATTLVMQWFDYGLSYRPVAEAIAREMPDSASCVAERNLTDTQRASLAYFVGLEPVAEKTPAGQACRWLLVVGDTRRELQAPGGQWQLAWEGSRPGNRKEKFRLFRR